MGAGIAKGIATQFPEAYSADKKTKKGDKSKLGTCSFADYIKAHGKFTVVNCYTQFDYRGKGEKVDYKAIRMCMRWIAENYGTAKIGLPKIGAGLAGGDWTRIVAIIEEELSHCDVTIVEFKLS